MLLGALYMLPLAYRAGVHHFWASAAFLVTGVLVFTASSIYHFLGDGFDISEDLALQLNRLDHFSIYLFIAGTYTPFILAAVSAPWRIPLIVLIWAIAIVGILYTWLKPMLPEFLQHRAVYTSVFVLMGWTIIIRISDVFYALSWAKLGLLVVGGLAYSVGAIVYATERPKLFEGFIGAHELWHLLVLLGASCHYFLILSFYLNGYSG